MKTIHKLLFLTALILATSCSDSPDKMLTVINPDGSCRREFSAYADSAFMVGDTADKSNPFPVEIDSSYFIAWQYKDREIHTDFPISQIVYDSFMLNNANTEKQKNFLIFASRNYKSVEQMAKEFKLKSSHPWKNMDIKYNFEKKFRFFYTYFSYKETYPQIEIPFDEPIENFMTEEEAAYWFTGEPNLIEGMNGVEIWEYIDDLQKKYDLWIKKNKWNMQYKIVAEHYDMINNPPVSQKEFINLRDTIFETYSNNKHFDWLINMTNFALDSYFKTRVFSEFWEKESDLIENADEEFENQDFISYFGNAFAYQLIMPGKIIFTNGVNRNDTLSWNLTAYRMANSDYTIKAQSRKLNIWMIVLTGVLAITAVVIFVYRRKNLYK
jgi:hypothetical protein